MLLNHLHWRRSQSSTVYLSLISPFSTVLGLFWKGGRRYNKACTVLMYHLDTHYRTRNILFTIPGGNDSSRSACTKCNSQSRAFDIGAERVLH